MNSSKKDYNKLYSFNWLDIFSHAKHKSAINELDIEQRLVSFPVEWLENVNWLPTPINKEKSRAALNQIADDFLLGKENTLGKHQPPIENAIPLD